MTDDGLKCSKQICKPAEDSFEKVWIEMKSKPSTKIMLYILVPLFLLLIGSIRGNYIIFSGAKSEIESTVSKAQAEITQKIFDKLTEVNRNIEKFSAQLESIKALGDRDSANNRQRIERLETWKERQK